MKPFALSTFTKITLLSFSILFCAGKVSAQADNLCVFNQATAPYQELTLDTDITSIVFMPDSYYTVLSVLGDTYPLMGQPWLIDTINAAIYVMKNGRTYLGLDTGFAIFDCLYNDSLVTIDASSKVSYKIEGSGNQEILKIQWKNLAVATGPAGNFINIQTWLYKETGVIEFHYGPRSANNASGYTSSGPTGIYTGIWYSDYNFTAMYEKIQVKGQPPAIQIDSNLNMNVPNIFGVPDSGTVYRFVPKAVAASVAVAMNEEAWSIVPNPAKDKVTVRLPSNEKALVTIVSVTGSVVYSKEVIGLRSVEINTSELAAGQYFVRVSNSAGERVKVLSVIK
ncbi:MAG TPA: T9SS type A sorting domain-containing protein [Flavipsychrobacter sp.]|nr:T9SS type A sorting domain-containing protein [Flavipsychrobacter sp.]